MPISPSSSISIPVVSSAGRCKAAKPPDVVLQALLMAVWRRKPKDKVLIHSDQGSQFTSMDWAPFLKHHNLVHCPLGDNLYRLPGKG